ncbi:hypothetical protein VC83_04352 [Pseudogymnoascus destructans]|uniref:Borealin N-terminal domain-containing protein n=2 Tax=Pseudogymnoascus destructans TaxID=655981 RepID=L8G582_PSED2|nr:uncharacterized protein VC83_04352 [Pseudogymnoascus destructans]ELR07989.1 hypothetical protein GMDG_08574 [Pseudogymnoascus destructans 20631-21]OAF59295.1 hypothetical protein VC83_04352 [Pseudogymnoascus destructans]
MAPTRQRKHGKSTESESSVDAMDFPAPPQTIPTKSSTPTRTPIRRSPMKKVPRGLTANQKRALLDNLQLEITERARKLRAQYMLQAQGLRTRIEIRVNRIPTGLRKAKMGDLLLKYNEAKSNAILPGMTARGGNMGSPSRNFLQENQRNARNSPSPMRQLERHSGHMLDKENEDLSNPKRRAKAAPAPRVASRTKQADQVLSPRSANSRNAPQPRSPIRPPTSLARPASPVKLLPPGGGASYLTNMVEKAKSSRAAATRASKTGTSAVGRPKKPVAAAAPAPRARRGRPSNSSESSDASARTTIVSRAPAAKKEPAKRTVMGALKSIGAKKTAAVPATSRPAPAGRVLRNRGAA